MHVLRLRSHIWVKITACLMFTLLFTGMIPLSAEAIVKTTTPKTGVNVRSNDKVAIDASNLEEGYVIIKYTGGKDVRIKAQVAKGKDSAYTYDINNKGNPEIVPISEGDGSYTISVLENVVDTKYALAYSTTLDVKLRDPLLPFLYANQYVNFVADPSKSKIVDTAKKIAEKAKNEANGANEQLEALKYIYRFVTSGMTYDTVLATNVKSGYLPNVDRILNEFVDDYLPGFLKVANMDGALNDFRKEYNGKLGKGICFDYAVLMSSMLRLQGIPAKLVIGYAGALYHAWINVYIEDIGWIDQAVYFDGKQWSLMDPTFVSTSNSTNAVKQFVGEGNNYSQKFVY